VEVEAWGHQRQGEVEEVVEEEARPYPSRAEGAAVAAAAVVVHQHWIRAEVVVEAEVEAGELRPAGRAEEAEAGVVEEEGPHRSCRLLPYP
jgi:hypothetical protein